MINNISLRKLRASEYIQFMIDTLRIIQLNSPEALMVKAQYDLLQQQLDEMEGGFKVKRASAFTKEIEELDALRNKAINGIRLMIHSLTHSTNTMLNNYATILETHLNLFGSSIARENYQSKTTILRNITDDWKTKPELTEAVEGLQLTAWQSELEQTNDMFNEAYANRNNELSNAPSQNLKMLRLEGNQAYYQLRDRLNAFMKINEGAEPWASTINQLNQQISSYLVLLNRRKAGNSQQDELA